MCQVNWQAGRPAHSGQVSKPAGPLGAGRQARRPIRGRQAGRPAYVCPRWHSRWSQHTITYTQGDTAVDLQGLMQLDVDNISAWVKLNKLTLNISKRAQC